MPSINRTLKRVPRLPRREPPGVGPLASIRDPALRLLIQMLNSRVTGQDKRLQTLDTYALKVGSPVNAYGQRIRNVGRPLNPNDAVPKWYLDQLIANQAQVAGSGGGGDSGTSPFGPIGAGSAPPTVALANLYPNVAAYAAANPVDLANSCLATGGTWAYMQGLLAALQAVDPRVGGNDKRGVPGDPSQDAFAYYHGVLPAVAGSKDVYVVDVIDKHCPLAGQVAGPAWNNVTTSRAAGGWRATTGP